MFLSNQSPNIFPHISPNYKHKLLPSPKFNDTLYNIDHTAKNEYSNNSTPQQKNVSNTLPKSILSFFSTDDLILLAVLCLLCNSENNNIFLIIIILLLFFDI